MYDRLVPALARGMDEVIENARDLEMVSPDHEVGLPLRCGRCSGLVHLAGLLSFIL